MQKQTATKQRPLKGKDVRKDFPLYAHANGQWCKTIRGRKCYFGPWNDPKSAEVEYLRQKEYLQAGLRPPAKEIEGFRIRDLANRFLTFKEKLVENDELSPRSFRDYHRHCKNIVEYFGADRLVESVTIDDFANYRAKLGDGKGVKTLGTAVRMCRMVFGFAYDLELIERPVRFGKAFKEPTKKSHRVERARKQREHGLKMFEAAEIQTLLAEATDNMRAMILLAINSGMGASDISALPSTFIDEEWIDYARIKTGIPRRIPLWNETREALATVVDRQDGTQRTVETDGLVFVTKYGLPFVRTGPSGTSNIDSVCTGFNKLLKSCDLKRHGVGFYALRHTFETIAGGCGDQVAVDAIMGHSADDMASLYRERIEDKRLQQVTNYVRKWLWTRPCEACQESQFSVDDNWKCEACGIEHLAD